MAEKLCNCFGKAVKSLEIMENKELLTPVNGIDDPIDITIKKNMRITQVPSSLSKKKVPINLQKFSFSQTDATGIEKEMNALNVKKGSTFNNILAKDLKQTSDICSPSLNKMWCEAVSKF